MGTPSAPTSTAPAQSDFLTPTTNNNGGGSDVISQLLALVGGGNNASQQANSSLGPATMSALTNAGMGPNAGGNAFNPANSDPDYQKGVAKALQNYSKMKQTQGENHATEALQAGVPPDHIQSQIYGQGSSPMAGGQVMSQFTPQQQQVLQTLQSGGQQQQPSLTQQQQNVNAIGQQATNTVIPGQGGFHPLGTLLNMTPFGQLTQLSQLAKLKGLGEAQTIASGKPAEIALPQAQANVENAKLKAGSPQADVDLVKQQAQSLQKEWENKAKEINAGIYATQNERANKLRENLINVRNQVIEQMKADLDKGPMLNRGQRLETYRKQLDAFDDKLQKMGNSGKYIATGTGPDGKKYGKNPDGSVEEITDGQ